jgi:hypothetical protein
MYFLLTSLLSALMLFGVSDTMVGNIIVVSAFKVVLGFSIFFLIFGFHLTIQVLEDLSMKTNPKEIKKAFEEALHEIEEGLNRATKAKKE